MPWPLAAGPVAAGAVTHTHKPFDPVTTPVIPLDTCAFFLFLHVHRAPRRFAWCAIFILRKCYVGETLLGGFLAVVGAVAFLALKSKSAAAPPPPPVAVKGRGKK